ncbi:heterokaryon incompatibility protein-domain-containing protein [Lasiosphaeris hirsuta]|uniref:Heterokaryon incompatibility protein-domain-containing protein n=1 Tax=Lasiosphaeris hirsuta TaxID=260670 RepID=A0AA40ANV3_9PEZI|nr:heterokaryon incompatibility protein-domain-containing protein [Lasiosphaeris hirsuta]
MSQTQRYDSSELKLIEEFKYDKLPTSKKRIRLLQLKSGTTHGPDIFCELIEADYDNDFHIPTRVTELTGEDVGGEGQETPPKRETGKDQKSQRKAIQYEALSWCWGTDAPEYALLITYKGTTYKKRVRKELGLALKYLRLPNKIRTLWIDAICINQDDHNERNHQVQMMSRIYTRASEVCVWLGEDSDESKTAIDFIHKEIMVLDNFDTLCTDKKYTEKWRALMMLMQREWFSRRWVVQEIALASKAKIYCGPDSIWWNEFAVAVELFVEVETATHRLSEIMQKDEKFRHVPGWFEHVSELGASLLVQATGKVFRAQRTPLGERNKGAEPELTHDDTLKQTTIDPLDRRSLLSLEYLVSTLFIFKATEPRDAVYALLAIARDASPFAKSDSSYNYGDQSLLILSVMSYFLEEKPFVVDYSRPYSDVCRDFVEFTILRKNKWDPVQALDILCRPWALDPPQGKSIHLPPAEAKPGAEREKTERPARQWKKREYKVVPGRLPKTKAGANKGKPIQQSREQQRRLTIASARRPMTEKPNGQDPGPSREPAQNSHHTSTDTKKQKQMKGKDIQEGSSMALKKVTLPSWVARASLAPFSLYPHPGMHIHKTGRSNADPLVGQPQDGHRNYSAAQTNPVDLKALKFRKREKCGHYSLYVRGFILDTVETVLDASQGGNIPKSWLDLGGWFNYQDDPPDHFWRTLVADRGRENRNPPYYYTTACKESILKGGILSGRVNTADLINNERNSIVAEFCRRVQAVIWSRRLFKTKNHGVLGLASEVQRGDQIAIIYGCTVPVILRRRKKVESSEEKSVESILKKEAFDDSVEALKTCLQRLERCRERKKRYEVKKKEFEKEGKDYVKEIREAKKRAEKKLEELAKTDGKTPSRYLEVLKSDQAAKEVYYEFNGEAYVHGMMDGEALRMKFYNEISDSLFELR